MTKEERIKKEADELYPVITVSGTYARRTAYISGAMAQDKHIREEIINSLRELYKKEFGELEDPTIERDGYFILGFVKSALDNIK